MANRKSKIKSDSLAGMRKRFVAVVGPRHSGKSTTIQSLSGCATHSTDDFVEDLSNHHFIYVLAASPQETGLPASDFQIILNTVLGRTLCQGLIAAIQPSRPTRRLWMEQMLNMARQSGFETFAFVLDPPRRGGVRQSFDQVRDRILHANPGAHVVRLDGRRFAVLNAEAIRAISRLPF